MDWFLLLCFSNFNYTGEALSYLLLGGILFISSGDFILSLTCYLFEIYLGFIVLLAGCFYDLFYVILGLFLALAANQISLGAVKLKLNLGVPDR